MIPISAVCLHQDILLINTLVYKVNNYYYPKLSTGNRPKILPPPSKRGKKYYKRVNIAPTKTFWFFSKSYVVAHFFLACFVEKKEK